MRSKWFMPLFCLGLGVVVLVASWLGGSLSAGVYGLVVLAVFGLALLLLTGRSETLRGLTIGRDERFAQIDLRATAVAGLVSLAILGGFGLFLLLVTGRSETVRGLTTDRDERFVQIDLKATAVAGLALIITVIVAWLVQVAQGHSGNPYGWLGAIGGIAYIRAVAFFRWRG